MQIFSQTVNKNTLGFLFEAIHWHVYTFVFQGYMSHIVIRGFDRDWHVNPIVERFTM